MECQLDNRQPVSKKNHFFLLKCTRTYVDSNNSTFLLKRRMERDGADWKGKNSIVELGIGINWIIQGYHSSGPALGRGHQTQLLSTTVTPEHRAYKSYQWWSAQQNFYLATLPGQTRQLVQFIGNHWFQIPPDVLSEF